MKSGPIAIEPIEKFHHGGLVWIDRGAALQLGDQPGSLDLRLTLRTGEAMPAAAPAASHRIVVIKDDCPVAWGSFADMAFHDFSFCQTARLRPHPLPRSL